MSPPAVHFRSPTPSSDSMPDATSHSPLNSSDFGFAYVNAQTLNPSTFADADSRGFAPPGRSRPRLRLVKHRKQSASLHARSRNRTATATAAGDGGSGFNPFRSASDSSDQVTGNTNVVNGARACDDIDGSFSNCHLKFGNTGFVFGAARVDSAPDLNSEQNRRGVATEKETGFGKSGRVEFVFNAKRSDVESSSLPERPKTGENAAKTVFCGERKMKLDSEFEYGECNSTGFLFYADQNESQGCKSSSNIEKGESSECVENLGFDGDRKCKSEVEFERWDSFDFVFGEKQSGKTFNFSMEKQESLNGVKNVGNGWGAFITKTETISNSNTGVDQFFNLGNDDKCKSGYGSTITNGISTANSSIPAYKLRDEMKKLNIKHSENVGSADIARDSKNSHITSSASFVFGGSEKVCGSFSVSLGTNADGQTSCTNAAFDNIGRQYFKTCETNDAQNRTGCGIASGSTGIPCSKPSTGQEGIKAFQCGKIPECHVPEDSQMNASEAPFSSSSFGLDSHLNNYASTGQSFSAHHDKRDNSFTSIPEASKESFVDFKPPTWDPSSFKENLFPKLNRKLESTQKGRSCKEKGSKQIRRKLKPHSLNKKQTRLDHLSKESSPLATPDSSGSQSPMDFSPYQETRADDQGVKASEELNDLHSTIPSDYKDEHLASVGRGVDINTTDHRCVDPDKDKLLPCNGSSSVGDFPSSGPEIVWPNLKIEQLSNSCIAGASANAGVDFSSNTERQNADQFSFVHDLGDSEKKDFAFSASSIGEGTSSSFKRKHKKKFRRKMGCDSFVISPNLNGKFESSIQFSPLATANMLSHSDVRDRSEINGQFNEGDAASSATIQETCDKWRLRGNQAYKNGDLSKAEDFYTLGINSVPSSERPGSCDIKPLLLCYSNRAATRMSLGRIKEALGDCLLANALNPTFLKVQMRTANCHLLLGEVENAQQYFNKCLESGNDVCLDRRVIVEAAEGLQKVQKVIKCINNATELLKQRTSDAAGTALKLLTKALSISSYSEKLLHMKAEALCLLQKYDEAVQLCEQSQCLAEKNFASANSANISMCDSYSCVKVWRWSLISRCYFHLGRLEESLTVVEKLQQIVPVTDNCAIENIEDLLSLAASIRELLQRKSAGNENFKLGKYTEAIEHYTVALSSNIKSRPFAAICFCNRAAAHQALGQIADAIADCSMAIALDGNYAKAISRRATLHEMVRDYEQAACDLRRLISVLETQSNEKTKDSPNGSNGVRELRQVHQRLLSVEDQARRGIPLEFYFILGIKPTDTATEIKKAYHKAALKHHPDKAGQLLARSEVGEEGQIWKEISQEVHKDADRLFKMIGEAYSVLSSSAKRSEYDLEEEIRKASKQSNRSGTCRRSSDVYGWGRPSDGYRSPSDRTSNRRHGQDHWKTYGHSYSRWHELLGSNIASSNQELKDWEGGKNRPHQWSDTCFTNFDNKAYLPALHSMLKGEGVMHTESQPNTDKEYNRAVLASFLEWYRCL